VTPARLITALITEKGIIYPPFKANIAKLLNSHSPARKTGAAPRARKTGKNG
jgi:hypothetical protein